MLKHALHTESPPLPAAPLDLTTLARRAGLPHPTFASARLAERYGLTLETPLVDRPELYDLVWAVRLALSGQLPCCHRYIAGDEFFELEFWSLLSGSNEPAAITVTAVLKAAHTEQATLHLLMPGEIIEPQRPHVLIVDDDEQVTKCLELLLERRGFQVSMAHTATVAFQSLQKQLPDLFLLDVDLPAFNGLELCRQLKADSRTAAIPVVFCSANFAARAEALASGGADFLEKPNDLDGLIPRLIAALQNQPLVKTTPNIKA